MRLAGRGDRGGDEAIARVGVVDADVEESVALVHVIADAFLARFNNGPLGSRRIGGKEPGFAGDVAAGGNQHVLSVPAATDVDVVALVLFVEDAGVGLGICSECVPEYK